MQRKNFTELNCTGDKWKLKFRMNVHIKIHDRQIIFSTTGHFGPSSTRIFGERPAIVLSLSQNTLWWIVTQQKEQTNKRTGAHSPIIYHTPYFQHEWEAFFFIWLISDMDESATAAAEKVQGLGEVLGCVLGLTARAQKHSTERKGHANKCRNNRWGKKINIPVEFVQIWVKVAHSVLDSSWPQNRSIEPNLGLFYKIRHTICRHSKFRATNNSPVSTSHFITSSLEVLWTHCDRRPQAIQLWALDNSWLLEQTLKWYA